MIVRLQEGDNIAMNDRIALYGDGCFTTIAVTQGKAELLSEHIQRLRVSTDRLHISFNGFDQIYAEVQALALTLFDGVIKVVISRGQGGRGYGTLNLSQSICYLSTSAKPNHYDYWQHNGISIFSCNTRLAQQPLLAGIKHLNRLEQVLVKHEIEQTQFDDALVSDTQGWVVEASAGNVFWRENHIWFTPDLAQNGVEGVMRNHLIGLFDRNNIKLNQTLAPIDRLFEAEEVFVCNCLMRIVPVISLMLKDNLKQWQIDDTQTRHLQQLLANELVCDD